MPLLRSTFDLIKGVFTRSRGPQAAKQYASTQRRAPHQFLVEQEIVLEESDEKCQNWLRQLNRSKKRKALEDFDDCIYKRVKSEQDSGYSEPKLLPSVSKQMDRWLMPPPATPLNRRRSYTREHTADPLQHESVGTVSEVKTQRTNLVEAQNDYDMEAARRRAAATQLPANSGVWEPAEQDLFYHLAYRGFEPLLPKTWMVDFPTLPISLFAQHNDVPFIEIHGSTEFRAIKALRELMDVGRTVRDRALVASKELRCEPIIEKATNRYVKWGLKDIGVSSKQCIPVHAVVSMKEGQTTRDTIRCLAIKMHKLSSRHREECDVLISVEQDDRNGASNMHSEARMGSGGVDSESQLPTIYGIMICSSLLAIFTLNSHTPSPFPVTHSQNSKGSQGSTPHSNANARNDDDDDEADSGLRFIASFDFSDSAADVWNAFVIVIVAMMIRKSLKEIYDITTANDEPELDESVLDNSVVEEDAEANRDRYNVRRVASGSQRAGREAEGSTLVAHGTDDPDL